MDTNKGTVGLSLLTPQQQEIEKRMSKKGASVSTDDQAEGRQPGGGTLAAALKAAGMGKLNKTSKPGIFATSSPVIVLVSLIA